MTAPLAGRYRRLLRVYPAGWRRDELLDTLMQAAPAGRSRPTVREAVNLLRCGLRARLGRPAGTGVVVMAVLVSLVTGYLGAAVADRLAWEAVPDFPTGGELQGITQTVLPGPPPWVERSSPGLFHDPMDRSTAEVVLRGHSEDFAYTTLDLGPPDRFLAGDYRPWIDGARDRLAAAGWTVGAVEPIGATDLDTGKLVEDGRALSATRDGLTIAVQAGTSAVDTPAGGFEVSASLARSTPWYVTALGAVGWLLGALGGWLATGWVSRRTERASGTVRSLTREPVVVALVLTVLPAVLGTLGLVLEPFVDSAPVQPFWSLSVTWFHGFTLVAAALGVLSVVVAAVGGRPAAELRRTPS